MKITSEIILKYDNLVHRNFHGELLEEIAKDFKISRYIGIFKSINKIHEIEGSLSHDVYVVRGRFREELKSYLEHQLTNDDFEIISKYI